jgi:hypothetical protein
VDRERIADRNHSHNFTSREAAYHANKGKSIGAMASGWQYPGRMRVATADTRYA